MLELELIIVFLLLGSVVGFMAGLLGIGGGGIMVPILTFILLLQGIVAVENVVHIALATSMACIVITSISSAKAHHFKAGVIWKIVKTMSFGVIAGAFITTFVVSIINAVCLAFFFAIFMTFIAVQMLLNKQPKANRTMDTKIRLIVVGYVIGTISSLVSIGGGSLSVPYLIAQNIEIKKAIGTSAALGVPISVAGTLGYVISGWQHTSNIDNTLGYVYIPAVILISLASFITVQYGADFAYKINSSMLKKIFAILIMIFSFKMLFFVW